MHIGQPCAKVRLCATKVDAHAIVTLASIAISRIDKRSALRYTGRMFKHTSAQRSLFGVETTMGPAKLSRLKKTWAHRYQQHALPLIDEKPFARYFHKDNGRPNKSIRLVLSVLILKEVFDLTDEEAIEQLEWNAAWQYALDITVEDAHLAQKTLYNHRMNLIGDDRGVGLFESMTARLIKTAGLKTGRQRLDSTHIMSNIKILTRLGSVCANHHSVSGGAARGVRRAMRDCA